MSTTTAGERLLALLSHPAVQEALSKMQRPQQRRREPITREGIRRLLATNNMAVERAIVALYRRQTEDEQQGSTTKHTNGRGFNATHASMGTYCAKWVLSGKHLSGRFLNEAREIALFYTRQLLEIAQENGR